MSRNEKLHKLSNAIKEYRGKGRQENGVIVHWIQAPKPNERARVEMWLTRLRLDVPHCMERIDGFKTLVEFQEWLKMLSLVPAGYQPMETAPRDGAEIIGIYEDGVQDHIQWADHRRCAGEGPGSHFRAGWESTEVRLMVDPPLAWRPA